MEIESAVQAGTGARASRYFQFGVAHIFLAAAPVINLQKSVSQITFKSPSQRELKMAVKKKAAKKAPAKKAAAKKVAKKAPAKKAAKKAPAKKAAKKVTKKK